MIDEVNEAEEGQKVCDGGLGRPSQGNTPSCTERTELSLAHFAHTLMYAHTTYYTGCSHDQLPRVELPSGSDETINKLTRRPLRRKDKREEFDNVYIVHLIGLFYMMVQRKRKGNVLEETREKRGKGKKVA